MKKVILTLTLVLATGNILNAHTSLEDDKIVEFNSHALCKATGISAAYTTAEILGEEPDVAVFLSVYKRCMGY